MKYRQYLEDRNVKIKKKKCFILHADAERDSLSLCMRVLLCVIMFRLKAYMYVFSNNNRRITLKAYIPVNDNASNVATLKNDNKIKGI